ncbi:hypothetical protein DPMN_043357 [Dreissena polymorpha]|uniref:Uncharacterized protein n=1 Tax=Dreissena polymorpha TaxID=45954 RepID=A0A9D4D249_DREPO|nr:hypothetical protein DPMN_043357 [Dreissena polymorpha]
MLNLQRLVELVGRLWVEQLLPVVVIQQQEGRQEEVRRVFVLEGERIECRLEHPLRKAVPCQCCHWDVQVGSPSLSG